MNIPIKKRKIPSLTKMTPRADKKLANKIRTPNQTKETPRGDNGQMRKSKCHNKATRLRTPLKD